MSDNNAHSAVRGNWAPSSQYSFQAQQGNDGPPVVFPQPPLGQPNPMAPAPRAPQPQITGNQGGAADTRKDGTGNGKDGQQPFPELGRVGSVLGWMLEFISPRSSTVETSRSQSINSGMVNLRSC